MTTGLAQQTTGRDQPRVLLVDDEPAILAGLRRQLRGHFEIVTATDGSAGLELLRREGPFDVVVSDMRMPAMDGATFLAAARMVARDTVRILLTGQADPDLDAAVAGMNHGQIFRFLSKPCPAELLHECLRAAVEEHRRSQARPAIVAQATRTVPLPSFVSGADEAADALGHAVAAEEFVVRCQPVADLVTQQVVGAEALLPRSDLTRVKPSKEDVHQDSPSTRRPERRSASTARP